LDRKAERPTGVTKIGGPSPKVNRVASKENILRVNQRKSRSLTAIHKHRDWVRDDTWRKPAVQMAAGLKPGPEGRGKPLPYDAE